MPTIKQAAIEMLTSALTALAREARDHGATEPGALAMVATELRSLANLFDQAAEEQAASLTPDRHQPADPFDLVPEVGQVYR